MNTKIWKRCMSLVVIMSMLLMTFLGSSITVMAESGSSPLISEVAASIDEELLLAGQTYDDSTHGRSAWTTAYPASYTVKDVKWETPGGEPLADGNKFEHMNEYKVIIYLEAVGDKFDQWRNVSATVNGEPANVINGDESNLQIEWIAYTNVLNYVNDISLYDVPEAAVGDEIKPFSYTHEENSEVMYTVTGKWEVWDDASKTYVTPSETVFADKNSYRRTFDIETMPGYVIEYGVVVYIDDKEWDYNINYFSSNSASLYSDYSLGLLIIDDIVIDEADLAKAVPGKKFTDTIITVPSKEESYSIKGYWADEEGNREGTFTKGKDYYFNYVITAAKDYYFAEDIYITMDDGFYGVDNYGKELHNTYVQSLKDQIDEVVLTGVPEVKIGDTLKAGDFNLKVPTGAKYKATASWGNSENALMTDTVVKAGDGYDLSIEIFADEGYIFADEFTLSMNGKKMIESGGYDSITICKSYNFFEQIDNVVVTGVKEPVVGETASTDTLKVPASANYEILNAAWHDARTFENVSQFEAGHAYFLEVEVVTKDGYEFAPYTKWTLGDFSDNAESSPGSYISMITGEYSFEKKISRVDIDNIPTKIIGKESKVDISIPNNAPYGAMAEWYVWNDESKRFEAFGGTFQKGKTYQLQIYVDALPGYTFDVDNADYYLDGKKIAPDFEAKYYTSFTFNYPNEEDKIIDIVELTIDKPIIGNHASIEPTVTVPEDAVYAVQQEGPFSQGPIWIEKYGEEIYRYFDYFVDGQDYGVKFILVAKEGYVFSDDLIVVVNGVAINADDSYISPKEYAVIYMFSMTCEHVYGEGGNVCKVCGYDNTPKEDANPVPNTGDNLGVEMAFSVMLLSVIATSGMILLNRKKV